MTLSQVRQIPAHTRGETIDLGFATIMNDLALPMREAHDAVNDAVMAGLAFAKLRSTSTEPDSHARLARTHLLSSERAQALSGAQMAAQRLLS